MLERRPGFGSAQLGGRAIPRLLLLPVLLPHTATSHPALQDTGGLLRTDPAQTVAGGRDRGGGGGGDRGRDRGEPLP